MSVESEADDTLYEPLTKVELDELAFMQASLFVGMLAARETQQTLDNYSGALFRGDVAFGD